MRIQVNPQKIINEGILTTCEHTKIAQVGIDLSIAETVDILFPGYANVMCNEIVNVPADMFALVVCRSTFNRQGVRVAGCVFDPSYRGKIHLSIYNLSGNVFKIEKGTRIAQMLFYKADAASQYNGSYQDEGLKMTGADAVNIAKQKTKNKN